MIFLNAFRLTKPTWNPKITNWMRKPTRYMRLPRCGSFSRAQIRTAVGSEVDFFVTSKDVVHGFTYQR